MTPQAPELGYGVTTQKATSLIEQMTAPYHGMPRLGSSETPWYVAQAGKGRFIVITSARILVQDPTDISRPEGYMWSHMITGTKHQARFGREHWVVHARVSKLKLALAYPEHDASRVLELVEHLRQHGNGEQGLKEWNVAAHALLGRPLPNSADPDPAAPGSALGGAVPPVPLAESTAGPLADIPSLGQDLHELKALHEEGLISSDEYAAARAAALDSLGGAVAADGPAVGPSQEQSAETSLAIRIAEDAGAEVTSIITADNDPNGLIGQPGAYVAKIFFSDPSVQSDARDDVSAGGSIEVFRSGEDVPDRIQRIHAGHKIIRSRLLAAGHSETASTLGEICAQAGAVLVRLTMTLPKDRAAAYGVAIYQETGILPVVVE